MKQTLPRNSWVLALALLWIWTGTPAQAQTPAPKAKKAAKQTTPKSTPKGPLIDPKKDQKQHESYLKLMRSEMNRYMKFFAKRPRPKVYHLRYQLMLYRQVNLTATDGYITSQGDSRKKPAMRLHVALRVGNHEFDNTGRDGSDWKIYRSLLPVTTVLPSELTDDILKKMLWQNTDQKYRIAFGQYWRKRYIRSTQPKVRDKAGDLSQEPATVYQAPLTPTMTFDLKKWKRILRKASVITQKANRVIRSKITLQAWERVTLGIDNHGSTVRLRDYGYNWSTQLAYFHPKTKELVGTSDAGFTRVESKLPNEKQLRDNLRGLWSNLQNLSKSEEGEPDVGPAIVGPYIAGAMFYDILMVRLATGRFLRKRDQRVFAKKMGKVILPTFLTIFDDPTMASWKGTPLSSHYTYDEEWVRARRMLMVENGVLKNFYLSRKPYKNYKRSNGHGRGAFAYQPFSRPGTTVVESKNAVSPAKLKQQLLAEIKRQGKRYGYILSRFQGYSEVRGSTYKVTPETLLRLDAKTGKTKRLKGLQVRSSALQVIQGILSTGNDYQVFNGSDSEDSGSVEIATVAPSLLIKRLGFHRIQIPERKFYKLPPPFAVTNLKQVSSKPKPSASCPPVDVCKRCAACQGKTK